VFKFRARNNHNVDKAPGFQWSLQILAPITILDKIFVFSGKKMIIKFEIVVKKVCQIFNNLNQLLVTLSCGCHNTRQHDNQHNATLYNNKNVKFNITTLRHLCCYAKCRLCFVPFMQNVVFFCYDECRYAECS